MALEKQIPLKDLPQTFRDAMELTRRLGYRYIWIDSLCIVQDSESDWHREALAMSSIYGNSSCNIAAMGDGGVDACFVQRNPLELFPCRITQQKGMNATYAFQEIVHKDIPLLSRGWVLQERLLSPRVIYYGMKELYWECRSQTASEAFPSLTREGHLSTYWWSDFLFGYVDRICCTKSDFESLCGHEAVDSEIDEMSTGVSDGTGYPKLTFARSWLKIVADYGGMKLTYESDRLIALAGVAKTIEQSRGFTYVAGTWKELWPIDLLWWDSSRCAPPKKTTHWSRSTVPSWSWTALTRTKRYLLLDDAFADAFEITYMAHVLEFTSPTFAARYTGTKADEESITLTLKGGVKRATVFRNSSLQEYREYKVRITSGIPSLFMEVTWDHAPCVGDSVVLLSLIRTKGQKCRSSHFGLVLVLDGGVNNKNGQPCYRRVGFWAEDISDVKIDVPWPEETVCLC